jgi:hypothetical protein
MVNRADCDKQNFADGMDARWFVATAVPASANFRATRRESFMMNPKKRRLLLIGIASLAPLLGSSRAGRNAGPMTVSLGGSERRADFLIAQFGAGLAD